MRANSVISEALSGQLADPVQLVDFSGGRVNVPQVFGRAGLEANQSPRSQNIDTSGRSIRKAKGFSKVTEAAGGGDISNIFYDEFTDIVYVSYANKLGKVTGNTITQLTGATGFTNNAIWQFARVGDLLFCTNGVDESRKWEEGSSTLSVITAPPATWGANNRPAACVEWCGRIFAFDLAGDPDVLYYSVLYDLDDWAPGSTAIDGGAAVIGDDGARIKACIPLAQGLIVLKEPGGGMWYFSGEGTYNGTANNNEFDQRTFDWQMIAPEVDCVGQRAWVVVGDVAYIMGREHVYRVRQTDSLTQVKVDIVSQSIANDIRNVVLRRNEICAVHHKARNQIWFGVAENAISTGVDVVHVYNYDNVDTKGIGAWDLRKGYSHKCMAQVYDSSGVEQIYSGGYSAGAYVYKQNDTKNFDGSPMECIHYTADVPLGIAAQGKGNILIVMCGSETVGNIQYSYAYDFADNYYDQDIITPPSPDSTWNTGGGSTWNSTGSGGTYQTTPASIVKVPMFGKGRRIQHRFYSNLVDADFDILELLMPLTTVGYV